MGSGGRKEGTSFHIVKQSTIKKNLKERTEVKRFEVKYAVSLFSETVLYSEV